jgi:hypothetical protein
LRDTVDALADLEQEEPPRELRAAIFASVVGKASTDSGAPRRTAVRSARRGLLRPRSLVPLAAGLVMGFLVSYVGLQRPGTADGVPGTAGALRRDLTDAVAVPIGITGVDAAASLQAASRDGRTVIRLSLVTRTALDVALEHGPEVSFSGYRAVGGAGGALRTETGRLVVENAGRGDYEFEFIHEGKAVPEIGLAVSHEGGIVARTLVQPERDR